MISLNQCNFIGNLGDDVEKKAMPNGKSVVNFSIAVANDYTKDGQKVEQTEWVRIVAFDKLADICGLYLKKGSKVFVTGRQQTRSWEQDGIKRYMTEIVISNMQMLDSREGAPQATQAPAPQQATAPQNDGFDDSEIPF